MCATRRYELRPAEMRATGYPMPVRIWRAGVMFEQAWGLKPLLNVLVRSNRGFNRPGYPRWLSMVSASESTVRPGDASSPRQTRLGVLGLAGRSIRCRPDAVARTAVTQSLAGCKGLGCPPGLVGTYGEHGKTVHGERGNPNHPPFWGWAAVADVVVWGRRTRSSPRWGKPTTWRRGPATTSVSW